MIRVAVIDDHTLVRAGLVALLRETPDVEVVAEGGDGGSAIKIAEDGGVDIMLLDLSMPVMSGMDVLPHIIAANAELKVIMLSMYSSEEHVILALRRGASGYLVKEDAPAELERALRTVMDGENWLSHPLSARVISSYAGRTGDKSRQPLTTRQIEVLKLMAEGESTREIAQALHLSVKTIETYRMQIMDRLCIFDVPGLVKYAIREGLTSL